MLKRLSSRYGDYAKRQESRLAQIAEQQKGFEAQAAGIRDPEREKQLTLTAQDWARKVGRIPGGPLAEARPGETNVAEQWFMGMPSKDLTRFRRLHEFYREARSRGPEGQAKFMAKQQRGREMMEKNAPEIFKQPWVSQQFPELDLREFYGGTDVAAADPILKQLIEAPRGKGAGWRGPYLREREFAREYTKLAQKQSEQNIADYEADIGEQVDVINRAYIPLGEEAEERRSRLQERADLYNMFLGRGY
jgi:hypothetical protein